MKQLIFKMTRLAALLLSLNTTLVFARATMQEVQLGDKTLEKVRIAEKANLRIGTRLYHMFSLGAGLRYKPTFIKNFKVYIAQFFSSDPDKFVKSPNGILDSLESMRAVSVRLSFLRSVKASQIVDSFKDALHANKIPEDDAEIKECLTGLEGLPKTEEGEVITVVGEKLPTGGEMIAYEDSSGKVMNFVGKKGFIKKLFSVWLGTPSDEGVTHLQKTAFGVAQSKKD